MPQDVVFDGDEDGKSSKSESLPPFASNGDISLWLEEDKNGDPYFVVDAPFLDSEPVFPADELKMGLGQLVEKWRDSREE